ncbi:MAG: hypothetical protein QN178_01720 [Armatimonadota bacterium]|nr:hypothetical protein [Armatimonadota bacterium]
MATAPARACVFCGRTPVTREHVWPEWVGKILDTIANSPYQNVLATPGTEKRWITKRLSITVARFCSQCNNEWMAELEAQAQPILTPMVLGTTPFTILSPADQVILSRWVFKTVLVANLTLPEQHVIPATTYREFYQNRVPPERGAVIWTAGYSGRMRWGHFTRHGLVLWRRETIGINVATGKEAHTQLPHTFVTLATLTTFRALFQVLFYFGGDWTPARVASEQTERIIIRLWPATGTPVLWPKDRYAIGSFDSLDNFSRRSDFF